MLEWMQRHNKYLVITVWISVLALVFAMVAEWGQGGFFSGGGNRVAKVGDKDISVNEYNQAYEQMYRALASLFSNDTRDRIPELENEVFRQLVREALLESLADTIGVSVSTGEIFSRIATIPAFLNASHQFDKNLYISVLEANGRKPSDFESIVSKEVLLEKMQNFPLFATSTLELNAGLSVDRVKDDISLRAISKEEILKDVNIKVTDSDTMSFWEKNKVRYYKPTTYRIAYIAMNFSDMNVSDEELSDFYNKNVVQYRPNSLQSDRDTIINDYKKSYATSAFSYLNSLDNKLQSMASKADFSNVISFADSNTLSALATYDASKGAVNADIKVNFVELSDNDMLRYSGLIEKISDDSGLLPPLEYGGNNWIVPYILEKKPSREMSFDEAKDKVRADLLQQKQDVEFKNLATNRLSKGDYDLVRMGMVSQQMLYDVNMNDNSASDGLQAKILSAGLDNNDIRGLFYNIVLDNRTSGVVFVNNKAIFYKIVAQKMPGYSELISASNDDINSIDEQKTRDMRDVMFEYATGEYKIVDYRSRH